MPDRKCPNCGNIVPEGSKFCNQCGAAMEVAEKQCPECGAIIPADSERCPNCNTRFKQAKVKTPKGWQDQNGSQNQQEGDNDHHTRNTVIVAIVVAFVALFIVNKCFYSGRNNVGIESSVIDTNDGNDTYYKDIFNRALEKNNMKTDGDKIAYVLPIPNDSSDEIHKLVGLTYLSDKNSSFYRIYELNGSGSDWDITKKVDQPVPGRALVFDQTELRAKEVPSLVKVGGKIYFYFAYADVPDGSKASEPGAYGKVVSALYDVEAGSISCKREFVGAYQVADADHLAQVTLTADPKGNGLLDQKLVELVQYIGYLKMPSSPVEAEEEAKQETQKEIEEKTDSVRKEQEKKAEEVKNGAEVEAGDVQEYDNDNPQFSAGDFSKKIQGTNYNVFFLKNGKVWAYNKSTKKQFEVFVGEPATDIGWSDNAGGILNVRTSSGTLIQYNLNSHTFKKSE